MSKNIKSCPFCGSDASVTLWHNEDLTVSGWGVYCDTCPVSTDDLESEEAAIEAWNRRKNEISYVGVAIVLIVSSLFVIGGLEIIFRILG